MVLAVSKRHVFTIGRWRFDATLGELADGAERRSLEHRAAATLAVLCRERGDVVTRRDLIDEIWNGRTVSPNSVAIVVADIRRALDDDAKAPTLLLTVKKRGYRLAPEPAKEVFGLTMSQPLPARWRSWLALGGVSVIALALFALALIDAHRNEASPISLAIGPVLNGTGVEGYGALTISLDELIVDQLARDGSLAVSKTSTALATGPRADFTLTAKLVLWNRLPTIHMTVAARETGRVVWSGMVVADADHIAAGTIFRLRELERRLAAMRLT